MPSHSLEDAIRSAGTPVELLRDLGVARFTDLPDEYTNWIDEQRAWEESVAFADQSYHMTDLRVEGPDAIDLYSDVGVNSFEGFDVGKAKQLVVANPNGYFIGDVILFHVDDEEFLSVGAAPAHNWLEFHADTGDYDVSVEFQPRPVGMDGDPNNFRFQVQGPDAVAVMEEAVDGEIPELGFFNFAPVEIDGHEVNLLRHGMAGEAGYEFWGPYENEPEVKRAVLEAGEAYDIERLGSLSYQTANVLLGWLPLPLPAVYSGEETAEFREWLPARRGMLSIGGSFDADEISDYYVTPVELGYDRVINFDHDFIGREALEAEVDEPKRKKVTLEWNGDDVVDVHRSLFEAGETKKYMELPHPRSGACPYDEVLVDGEHVGVSTDKSYIYQERSMLSLGVLDVEYAEPGTEVTIVWGEPTDHTNPRVADHEPTEIRATVAPVPYKEDRR
jgi:glycine cleavage system aminomethyltransferase T